MKTENTISRLLMIGQEPDIGTYISHRNALGSDVIHCYLGVIEKRDDITFIRLGLYPSKEKPRGFMIDYGKAGDYRVHENQNLWN